MQGASNKIVSVIIVSAGIKDYLDSCLKSLKNQTYKNLEIIVVDNSPDRNSSRQISGSWPGIKLFSKPENLFYAEALNKGISASKGDFILCLNDDVTLDERFIQEAIRGFYLDDSVGMVSGKILRRDGINIDSTGLFLSLWRTPRERGYHKKDRNQYNCPGYVFGVNGAVAFYRRDMLEKIKLDSEYFDSDFRMFYEDLDIAWRANLYGWKGYYVPTAIAYHVRGGTVRQNLGINKPYARRYLSEELHSYLIRNRYLTIIKNESVAGFLLHLPFILAYDFFIFVYLMFFKPVLLRRLFPDLRYINSALKKRKIIQNRRR